MEKRSKGRPTKWVVWTPLTFSLLAVVWQVVRMYLFGRMKSARVELLSEGDYNPVIRFAPYVGIIDTVGLLLSLTAFLALVVCWIRSGGWSDNSRLVRIALLALMGAVILLSLVL